MYQIKKGASLADVIRSKQTTFTMPCDGSGQCGKCKVRLLEGSLVTTDKERRLLSEDEIKEGIVLACCHQHCEMDCLFELPHEYIPYAILGNSIKKFTGTKEEGLAIALDIGTTTIVMCLLDLSNGEVMEEHCFQNPQAVYGSDVIHRIEYCMKHDVASIQNVLLQEIWETMKMFPLSKVKRMVVVGNPTMTHIFMGVDPTAIGQAPYTTPIKDFCTLRVADIFVQCRASFPIQVLPSISAFVGSEVFMGMYLQPQQEPYLFIDLGTNGEIVLYKDDVYYVTSAACGPAFEGGNMEYGCGALDGAICEVQYDKGWKYTTIHNKDVIGICGSGYLSLLSCARQQQFIDESGILKETITLHKNAMLTQKDVREFQLAKAALAAALLCLCEHANVEYPEIQHVYLAGGFASHIQLDTIFQLGLLPHVFCERVKVVGNSAIEGACYYALHQEREKIDLMKSKSRTLTLANNASFTKAFMNTMMLEEL